MNYLNQTVVLGFSGGPDAAALAYKLQRLGAKIIPVYINYRKYSGGGKTGKDLQAAKRSIDLLCLNELLQVRYPLGNRLKSMRNRFFIEVLSGIAKNYKTKHIALGTLQEAGEDDLNPTVLKSYSRKYGVDITTWDSFGVIEKCDEFLEINNPQFLFETTSCQMWWKKECGNCYSCLSRHTAFIKVFKHDPTAYRLGSKVTTQ